HRLSEYHEPAEYHFRTPAHQDTVNLKSPHAYVLPLRLDLDALPESRPHPCSPLYQKAYARTSGTIENMPEITLILHNIRSTHNVGAIFRSAEGFGVKEIILSGYTPYPEITDDPR